MLGKLRIQGRCTVRRLSFGQMQIFPEITNGIPVQTAHRAAVSQQNVCDEGRCEHVQFDFARFDSSCDENTRRLRRVMCHAEDSCWCPKAFRCRPMSHQRYGMCAIRTESVVSRANLDDSHDQRLRRVRQRVKSDVAAVVEVFRTLSGRVGPVRANQEVPRQILRQTWSALNVPLMWAASSGDEECPVLLWVGMLANKWNRVRL